MQFNHYGGEAALLAAALVNIDDAAIPQRVQQILTDHHVASPALTAVQARAIVRWGEQLAGCFDEADIERRCAAVNTLLEATTSRPRISLHDGHPHLHYRSLEDDVVSRVRAITTTGLAYIVCFAGGQRLGRCARPGCGVVYVDTSRNGARRYCCVRCANSSAVARHREQRSG